ncbi:hypothetical protein PAAG_11594 [Paracoccidioides lutzii Pb01]|uniref:Uncharacterized protein n=1 Tax=Paracoccidioides lutzii (strain ATCC MYA-826 / Pb01) TaxID=502779 RepID=A0A0A2V299_PARBA|nr:hypothetical protein PAAG_11594 [Paracoccidioides lutzii Pb01]KGQ01613.1 hypothetical protein PAAG_11594 [Paracoccidioides lutzii Pb01]
MEEEMKVWMQSKLLKLRRDEVTAGGPPFVISTRENKHPELIVKLTPKLLLANMAIFHTSSANSPRRSITAHRGTYASNEDEEIDLYDISEPWD